MLLYSPFVLAATAALLGFSPVIAAPAKKFDGSLEPRSNCHYLPTDLQWPGLADWKQLNQSVNGKLILGKPLAQICHNSDNDLAECAEIKNTWTEPLTYFTDPVNVMAPYWLNDSCSPFTSTNTTCDLGNIASYAINVSSADDVIAGLKFATENKVRITIKTLAMTTLVDQTAKDISFLNYTSTNYTGPAVKAGAGVQFYEAYEIAAENGLRVVGGFCPTVGIAGGYVQGGGHGPLGATYGLSADNALEFEVVTADGRHLIATPEENPDLYWALSGGGGGTYAVVISLTTKAHVDGIVAGGSFTINNTGDARYWSAIEAWQKHLLILDQIPGFTTVWGFTSDAFELEFATWPGGDASIMDEALASYKKEIEALNITFAAYETSDRPSFYDHYEHYTGSLPYGPYTTNDIIGGRLIPRSTVQNNATDLISIFKDIISTTGIPATSLRINGIAANVTHARVGNHVGSNAVLPAWRDSLYWLNVDVGIEAAASRETIHQIQAQVNAFQDQFKVLTPGGGSYMNEATFDNPTWKEDYYGANYDQLLEVKLSYDPNFVLYAHTSVGSDLMTMASDGRLCKD
ncbi:FAD binding domain protein [Botrytis cinerea]